jgi:arginase
VAAHDLHTPLRTVAGLTELVLRDHGGSLPDQARAVPRDDDRQRGGGRPAARQPAHLRARRRDPRDRSRASRRRGGRARCSRPLRVAIDDRAAEIGVGPLPPVRADAVQLAQLLQNLIANAIKFTPQERAPAITITGVPLGAMVQLDVSDNGIGIAPQEADGLFAMFRRGDSSGTYGGAGIGLAVCARIVERHGDASGASPDLRRHGVLLHASVGLRGGRGRAVAPCAQSSSSCRTSSAARVSAWARPSGAARGRDRGAGPERVERIGLGRSVRQRDRRVLDLNRQVARAVARRARARRAPVVLTGTAHTQQAVVAGTGTDGLGLVWLDCHADFHTPETTPSGFFDGQGLSMVVGDCWRALCATVPGFTALPADRVVLAGARDVDAGERERLARSGVVELAPGEIGRLGETLPAGERVSLHLDLDVLDPSSGRANGFAVPPGLDRDELLGAVRAVAAQRELAALTLSAYDPSFDDGGLVHGIALDVLRLVA